MTRIFKTLKPVSCCLLAVVMFASCILPSAKTPTASAADVTVEVTTPAQGDINGDGAVNMMDITYLYNAVSGKITADLPDSADLNNDGSVNVMDVNALYRHVSGAQALAPAPSEFDLEVLRYVNIEREKAGVKPLEYGYAYQAAANIRANEVSQFFSHTRPDGSMCFTVLDEYDDLWYSYAGENIVTYVTSPAEAVSAWMFSEGHRANILSPYFTHMIVGFAPTEEYSWYYSAVQLFYAV